MKSIGLQLLGLILLSTQVGAQSLEEMIASPDDIIEGRRISEFGDLWWQWTYSMPAESSPVRDLTGENCSQGQSGAVWFLAGGYGSSIIKRKCEVPAGKYIFFPVINMVYWRPEGATLSCERVKELAALNNDELLEIAIQLDAAQAANPAHSRLASENCFDLYGKVPRELNPPKAYPAASDGYWVMLKPLSKGRHVLKFQAKYDREDGAYGQMLQNIEYELVVQ
jgi:hypothetical protein